MPDPLSVPEARTFIKVLRAPALHPNPDFIPPLLHADSDSCPTESTSLGVGGLSLALPEQTTLPPTPGAPRLCSARVSHHTSVSCDTATCSQAGSRLTESRTVRRRGRSAGSALQKLRPCPHIPSLRGSECKLRPVVTFSSFCL